MIELTPEIAESAGTFEDAAIRDPADRIIVATALHHEATLVTKDHKIASARLLKILW